MKILDQYIIKQFLKSFFFMFLLFIPIGILVDVSEKIDKFKEHELGFYEIFNYYLDFVWYYGYFLFPIFVFLAVIWFTSKLSTNSEVVAILSSGASFRRYLHPFILTSNKYLKMNFCMLVHIIKQQIKLIISLLKNLMVIDWKKKYLQEI